MTITSNGKPLVGTDLGVTGVSAVPRSDAVLKAKDFTSDQEVRWCPGCGDYVVLATVRSFLPELGLKRENMMFVSGIGCAVAFPVLPGYVWGAFDSRAGADDCDGVGGDASGSVGVGGDRGWGCALDRR